MPEKKIVGYDVVLPFLTKETAEHALREVQHNVGYDGDVIPTTQELEDAILMLIDPIGAPKQSLFTLAEAAAILNGPRPLSGKVTPESPFGQSTVTLPDGRKANSLTGEIAS